MGPASDKEVDDKHDECDSDASRHDAELGHCHGDDDDDDEVMMPMTTVVMA